MGLKSLLRYIYANVFLNNEIAFFRKLLSYEKYYHTLDVT